MQSAELAEIARRQALLERDIDAVERKIAALEDELRGLEAERKRLAAAALGELEREQEWQRRERVVDDVMDSHVRNVRVPPYANERLPLDRPASGEQREMWRTCPGQGKCSRWNQQHVHMADGMVL